MQEHRQAIGLTSTCPSQSGVSSDRLAAQQDLKKILIVRPTALGDVCRTVSVLMMLREAHPDARIDWVVNEPFIDAIRHHPALTEAIAFPRARFGGAWRNPKIAREATRWVMGLRRREYDVVFDLQGLARSGLITRLSGSPLRVGFADAREGAALAYNRKHLIDPDWHTVNRMIGLLEAEGYTRSEDLRLYASEEDIAWRRRLFEENGLEVDDGYVCLAPTAQWLCKCWPANNFREIARRILEASSGGSPGSCGSRGSCGIVIIATPNEQRMIQPLLDGLKGEARVLVPKTTVGQMMALIRDSSLLVGNDSAPLHIAVGFGRPIVAIFGPTDPDLVGPYGQMEAVLRPAVADEDLRPYRRYKDDQTLISRVSVAEVWERIEAVLGV